jgi:uncharacterized membrane protein
MVDDKTRSLIKGLTWRVIATSDTIFLAWLFTGSITAAISIGLLELLTKTFLYYVHERAWARIVHMWRKKGSKKVMWETSVGKALTWRVLASADTTFLTWLVTGDIIAAVSIGAVEVFTKLFFYYTHERVWAKVSWGRRKIHI